MGVERLDRADLARPGHARARTARGAAQLEPDVVHLHEPIVPGPTVSALIGFNGPMVGTFHAAGEDGAATSG